MASCERGESRASKGDEADGGGVFFLFFSFLHFPFFFDARRAPRVPVATRTRVQDRGTSHYEASCSSTALPRLSRQREVRPTRLGGRDAAVSSALPLRGWVSDLGSSSAVGEQANPRAGPTGVSDRGASSSTEFSGSPDVTLHG